MLRGRSHWFLAALITLAPGSTPSHAQAGQHDRPGFERLLLKPRGAVPEARLRAMLQREGATESEFLPQIGVRIVLVPAGQSGRIQAAWARHEDVEYVEPDVNMPPAAVPNDPRYGSQWHLQKIGAPLAWDSTAGTPGVVIAILDSGVDPTHPDLAGQLLPGWNFYDGNSNTADVNGHGTAVAGCAAAAGNNSIGVASIAMNCRILPVRISDPNAYALWSTVAKGLTYAADQGARVANISYAASTSSSVTSAAQYFMGKGGVVCIAAGNDGASLTSNDNPHVLTVAATDANDQRPSWSNYGNLIDLSAPGQGVLTTTRGGGYGSATGTSFSAPLVAGTAALVFSVRPDLEPTTVQDVLKLSALDLGNAGWDSSYGWGRLDAAAAVALALDAVVTPPNPDPDPVLDVIPPTVTITSPADGSGVKSTVSVRVNAADNIAVTRVSLFVDGALVSSSTTSPFTTSWNPRKASLGYHQLQCVAEDAAGNSSTSQVVQVRK